MSNHSDREVRLQYNRLYTSNLVQQRRTNGLCLNCGKTARVGMTQCQECANYNTQRLLERRMSYKRKAVEYLGGKCIDCGFRAEIIAVYDFHHVSGEKKTTIARMLDTVKSWTRIQEELDKCVLLCANCHRIRHALEDMAPP
ncbi:MAG TPA: hypothetical protein VIX20_13735 [Ktedonobacteraceae bacterium]